MYIPVLFGYRLSIQALKTEWIFLNHVTIWRVNDRAFTARRKLETCGDLGLEAAPKVALEPQQTTNYAKETPQYPLEYHVACMFSTSLLVPKY